MPSSFKASGKVECVASLPIPSSPHFSTHSVKLRSFIELFYRPAPSLLYWLGKCSQYYNNQRSCSRVFLFHDLRMSPSPRSAISLTHNFKTTSLILCKTPLCCQNSSHRSVDTGSLWCPLFVGPLGPVILQDRPSIDQYCISKPHQFSPIGIWIVLVTPCLLVFEMSRLMSGQIFHWAQITVFESSVFLGRLKWL